MLPPELGSGSGMTWWRRLRDWQQEGRFDAANLRAIDIYTKYGLGFLRALKEKLPFHSISTWTTESLLADLERITPGFQRWADEFQNGGKYSENN
jgi:hypothetical protein